MIGGPESPANHRWRIHEGLRTTEQGLYLWTCYSHSDGHKFVKLTDDKLWEWGYE
jgi:hypothetical protein